MARLSCEALDALVAGALTAAGYSAENAGSLARQIVLAEALGQPSVGVSHVFDFIDGLAAGRIDGAAAPTLTRPAPGVIAVDGHGGLPQRGFDEAFDRLVGAAREAGVGVLLHRNATLCGSLGTFALRVAEAGLACLAATNGSPLLAGSGSSDAVFCTNPLAFAVPQAGGPPLLIDQASSATAYVNIREAAERGAPIPAGWALDRDGRPTEDPQAALAGTLLPFGGARGGNIALMVEVLAAGLTGANWSLDAPSFFAGEGKPGVGLFVLAMNPRIVDADFETRMAAQARRLGERHGVHIPGPSKHERRRRAEACGLEVEDSAVARLRALATAPSSPVQGSTPPPSGSSA